MTILHKKKLNDIEEWVGIRRKFLGQRRKQFVKLNGSAMTVHATPKSPIDYDLTVLGASVIPSLFRRMITIQTSSGLKYHFHLESWEACTKWTDWVQSASAKSFEKDYELGEKIGEGSFATVYKGRRRSDGTTVAIKKIVKRQFDMTTARELEREIYAMKNIRHESVVPTYDVYNGQKEVHLVLEYMKGGSLKQYSQRNGGQFREEVAIRIVRQILSALAYLHANGYAHRDIKLENVLCDSSDVLTTKVSLADFGYVNFVDDIGDKCMQSLIGTPVYVAPEIVSRKPYGAAVDLYAVGVMVYRMLSGEYPYDGGSDDDETMALATEACLQFNHPIWKTLSQNAKSFVRGLLQTNPEKRLTARGALCHSWLAEIEESKCLSRPGKEIKTPRLNISERIILKNKSELLLSPITPINVDPERNLNSRPSCVRNLISQFSSGADSPNSRQPSTSSAEYGEGKLENCTPREEKTSSNNGDICKNSRSITEDTDEAVDIQAARDQRYTGDELRRKLRKHIFVVICVSKLLAFSELRIPGVRAHHHKNLESSRFPDKSDVTDRRGDGGAPHEKYSPRALFRAFSISRFTNRESLAADQPSSPMHGLGLRLKRTFSLSGRRRE